jgi:hypothetical protein
MTHSLFKSIGLLSFLAISVLLAGCEGERSNTSETAEYMDSNSVELDNQSGKINLDERPALSVTPTSAGVLEVGDTVVFTAAGGSPPYDWGIGSVVNGSIDKSQGNPCFYTCLKLKQNSIFVKDSRGKVAAATITVSTP